MALSLSFGALVLGALANWMRRRAGKMEALFGLVAVTLIAAELMLVLHPPWPSLLPWCAVSVAGSATALSYVIIGDYFPPELAARANGGLNVLQFWWTFFVQFGTGLILEQWPLDAGHSPLIAFGMKRIAAADGAGLVCRSPASPGREGWRIGRGPNGARMEPG